MQVEKNFLEHNIVKIITIILTIILTVLVLLLVSDIGKLQGNARVVNYAGIVRGATQRLIKLEIAGSADDELLEYLNNIIYGLQNGSEEYNLIALEDSDYQKKLYLLITEWELLKLDIYDARIQGYKNTKLLERSESYFHMADDTVAAAELYSEDLAIHITKIEYFLIGDIVIMFIILILQITSSIKISRKHRELSKIVHIDAQTKIPNKLSCDMQLSACTELDPAKKYGCAMFDLNNLKTTNDSFGHSVGDMLIIEFAKLLRNNFSIDVFVGRYGGDEFIAIFEDLTKEEVEVCVNNIKEQAIELHKKYPFKVEFACGYALSDEVEVSNLFELLEHADARMYMDKNETKKYREKKV